MRKVTWIAAAPVAVVALLFGGAWFYTHLVEGAPPDRLTLGAATSSPAAPGTATTSTGVDGTWTATSGSVAGYRVKEILFGNNATAVGRTDQVTGSLTLAGTRVTAASFTVDLASVSSDQSRRDNQFRGRIMDVATFPTATFRLTAPISLGSVPANGVTVTAEATGDLTLHGVTKRVTFTVQALRDGSTVKVNGSIPVVFADYGIGDPSFGPAQVEDHGEVEFLLVFSR